MMPPTKTVESDNVVTTSTAIVVIAADVEYVESPEKPRAMTSSKKRAVIALATALLVVAAVVAAVLALKQTVSSTGVAVGGASGATVSICYDSWNSYSPGNMQAQFARIKERFSGIRTFQTQGSQNHIVVAAQTGLTIYAGVWIQSGNVQGDMQAAVDGARQYPGAIKAILVGNEELLAGLGPQFVIDKVNQMKSMLRAAGVASIKVGSAQTDGDWLNPANAGLVAACDVIGVNIHPFFSSSSVSTSNPIQDLQARWRAITSQYFGTKAVLTETGWPTGGSSLNGHVPGMALANKYINDVTDWVLSGGGGDAPAYFMFSDNPTKTVDFEKTFGLASADLAWKFDFTLANHGNDPPPAPTTQTQGVVFVNTPNDQVLAVTPNRGVEFHARWGNAWRSDVASQWTVRGALVASWETKTRTDVCLDAYEPWNGGAVHVWPCDAGNVNQQWNYDSKSHQLRHVTHNGFCLDMSNPMGGPPHLWTCHDPNDPYVSLQQVQWWQAW
ncbi:Aste57867_20770 [Aphanomyces stellatus]|uniref:glucan endo-1,3-beta-D-glucosidase n=1 Tax=Aphanomyces stellatus TaxID=120398 RepID=A0A485LHU6_9STRA|nr:hypothetical protein As57867_020702 [Aphanomyces stellatus]VFT97449.1 Aste57867_20770 [Aphanomyces stellatus]